MKGHNPSEQRAQVYARHIVRARSVPKAAQLKGSYLLKKDAPLFSKRQGRPLPARPLKKHCDLRPIMCGLQTSTFKEQAMSLPAT